MAQEMKFGKSGDKESPDPVMRTVSKEPPKDPRLYFKGGSQVKALKGLRLAVWGGPGTGKSNLCFTMPKPIRAINTDFGMYPLLEQKEFAQWLKPNLLEDMIEIAEIGAMDEFTKEPDPLASLTAIEEALTSLVGMELGTICLDSGSDVWQFISHWLEEVAHFRSAKTGDKYQFEWGKANARYRLIMMRIVSKPINLVITGQSSIVYRDGNPTDDLKADWMKKTPYWADLELEMQRRSDKVFQAKVRKCRLGANKTDLIINPTYENIVKWVRTEFPERTIYTQGITSIDQVNNSPEVKPIV
jgi:hypothetical protein